MQQISFLIILTSCDWNLKNKNSLLLTMMQTTNFLVKNVRLNFVKKILALYYWQIWKRPYN